MCDNTGLASSLPDDSLSVGQHSVTEAHVNTPLLHYNIRSHQAVYTLLPPARRVSMCTAATSRPRPVLFQRWSSVCDAGPTSRQHRVNVLCFLGSLEAAAGSTSRVFLPFKATVFFDFFLICVVPKRTTYFLLYTNFQTISLHFLKHYFIVMRQLL